MGRGNRAYKSAKRNKELQRLKKQEEKRLRRLGRLKAEEEGEAPPVEAGAEPETDLLAGLGIDSGDSGDAEAGSPGSDGSSDD